MIIIGGALPMKINFNMFTNTYLSLKDVAIGRAVCLRSDTSKCGVISGVSQRFDNISYPFYGRRKPRPVVQVTYSDGSKSSWLHPDTFRDIEKYQTAVQKLHDDVMRCRADVSSALDHFKREQEDGNQAG